MRLTLSSVAAACLLMVGTAVGASATDIQVGKTYAGEGAGPAVFVQDDFLDAATRDALLMGLPVDSIEGGRYKHLSVPASLSERVMAALGRFVPGAVHPTAAKDMLLPFTEHVGDEHEHHDHHRGGEHRGQMAQGHVGVVYLEGDGDFVFTNTVTGVEARVAIAPGKFISWPNMGFRHRVDSRGSMPRRLLGPMVLDVSSGNLLGVGNDVSCSGYECLDTSPATTETASYNNCDIFCISIPGGYSSFSFKDTSAATNECKCYNGCTNFGVALMVTYYPKNSGDSCPTSPPTSSPSSSPSATPSTPPSTSPSASPSSSPSASPSNAPSTAPTSSPSSTLSASPSTSPSASPSTSPTGSPSTSPSASPSNAPTPSPPDDPISVSAASYNGRTSVRRGLFYTLFVTLNLPAANTLGRRELVKADGDKHAVNTTTYALLLEAPGATDVTYKRTSVHPRLKPASLKKPTKQDGGDLLWTNVAMPLYATKASKRAFKVTFKVNSGATSPLVFVASVWKDGIKLQTAASVQVTVTSK